MTPKEYLRWFKGIEVGGRVGILFSASRLTQKPRHVRTVRKDEFGLMCIKYGEVWWQLPKEDDLLEWMYKQCLHWEMVKYNATLFPWAEFPIQEYLIVPGRGLPNPT